MILFLFAGNLVFQLATLVVNSILITIITIITNKKNEQPFKHSMSQINGI